MYEAEAKLRLLLEKPMPEKSRRIIFWYDESQLYKEEVDAYEFEGVQLIKVTDSNFIWTKYQIEKAHPDASFLLYFDTGRPHDLQNPLIDIYLYGEEFKMDAMASLMDEIGMTNRESELFFQNHASFFQNKKRQKEFRDLVVHESNLTFDKLSLAMFCVLARVKELSFSVLCEQLFLEESQGRREGWTQIEKFASEAEFWEMAKQKYHYKQTTPTVREFLLSIFVTKLSVELEGKIPANWQAWDMEPKNNSVVFLNRWMNQTKGKEEYAVVADYVAVELQISKFLKRKPLEFVALSDAFRQMDEYLSEAIAETLLSTTVSYDALEKLILSRRNTFWQMEFKGAYQGLLAAVRLFKGVDNWEKQTVDTEQDFLWSGYKNHYFQIDQNYRYFYLAYDRLTNASDHYHHLQEKVENFYKNGFLNDFAEKWSEAIGYSPQIDIPETTKQTDFYQTYVAPFVKDQKRIIVIISDALRYEAGMELARELGDSHYYVVETEAMQGVIPSYTALGMASLLPKDELSYKGNQVLVDGQNSHGLENRRKILQKKFGEGQANAFRARDILQATKSEMREAFVGGQVYYIFHDAIDAMGDNASSEDRVFSAVETAKQELRNLADKLVNNISAANLLITADHGFLYTRDPLMKFDRLPAKMEQSLVNNRRFYLDQNSDEVEGMHTFEVGAVTSPNLFAHIPRGTMRLAISGSGDKFVHGGSLPQEIMVPVLKVKAERGRDTRTKVGVQLITELNRITNVVTHLSFLQLQKVTSTMLSRTVRAYFVDSEGKLVSNEVILLADSTSDSPNDRIIKEKFVFANREYRSMDEYYFVMEDEATGEVVEKRQFTIDLYYFE
ncbi:BREX-1 system phosphatase PglZ type A [Jeotgalibaca caeni]|uniref:BREX-1 system phosphatase PglZ type A n=1 Tax=Jeotgalibaca caeni TaxID=3028623 RepID=UPI00237D359C|nr:BREX-1 system phosphatase PglZ type A [Jeotgalibaca caeni]MDE1549164.1 BREX-1 system phosphatase PglZ type A [Jeotgalibaca caeni]